MVGLIEIKVPATSANLGPGFDCLGLALSVYNHFRFEELDFGVEVNVEGAGADRIPRNEDNLVVQALRAAYHHSFSRPKGVRISIFNNIPPGSGLGSSATAVVAGLLGGFALSGTKPKKGELIKLAVELEGHSDNVVPAILGGLTVSRVKGDDVSYIRLEPRISGKVLLIIPDVSVDTAYARSILPEAVRFSEAVANIGNASLLLAALVSGEERLLKEACQDYIHQPYRTQLVPGLSEALRAAVDAGASFASLSGSGPTIISFCRQDLCSTVSSAVREVFRRNGISSRILVAEVDTCGARVFDCD